MPALMPTYARLPVAFARGEGARLWDTDGKEYLDALSGIAVCGLGHAHPDIAKAICNQAGTLIHTSNLYGIPLQEQLGEKLIALSNMERVFFSNSGAEANEAAIKLARLYGSRKKIKDPHIIVMESSFHGRTLATLTATGSRKAQAGFEPLVKGFIRVPYNDLEAIRNVAANNDNVVAVLVEPVQGEGGINVPAADYLNGIRQICDEHDWLMMLDEIQTGMARSGRWFSHMHNGIQPDVMTLAKGLGNGMPIGACLARGAAAEVFGPGNHGSTFGGNPLACATALEVINIIERDGLIERAATLGNMIGEGLQSALADCASVSNIRQQGLLIGIELDKPCAALVTEALAQGLLINVTAERVIRLLPPLIISDEQARSIVEQVSSLVRNFN